LVVPTPAVQPMASALLRYRNSAQKLTPDQLAAFRRAVLQAKAITDERGFNYWAGIHGLPLPKYCHHGDELFLTWHRAYLYFFELSLQDQVAGVTLPWWDWTSPTSHATGIPAAYATQSENSSPNPLFESIIPDVARIDPESGQQAPKNTTRSPDALTDLPTGEEIAQVLAAPDFLDFSQRVENVHNHVHVWVGGTMAEIPWAAYDLLFWAHHAMIDRLWDLWQLQHPSVGPPNELLSQVLPPFQMTVTQTLSVNLLGYEYAAFTATAPAGG
jgi:tyrosinase